MLFLHMFTIFLPQFNYVTTMYMFPDLLADLSFCTSKKLTFQSAKLRCGKGEIPTAGIGRFWLETLRATAAER